MRLLLIVVVVSAAAAGCGDKLFRFEVRQTPAPGASYEIRVEDDTFGPGTAFLIVREYADYESGKDDQVIFSSFVGGVEQDQFDATPGACAGVCLTESCDQREVTLEQVTLSVQTDGQFVLAPNLYCVIGGEVFSMP